jgi:hypothetical protein
MFSNGPVSCEVFADGVFWPGVRCAKAVEAEATRRVATTRILSFLDIIISCGLVIAGTTDAGEIGEPPKRECVIAHTSNRFLASTDDSF